MNQTRARQVVAERSAGMCEVCGQARATEWHHRRNRSQGGRWCPANGIHACSQCHHWITHHPAEAVALGLALRHGDDPERVPVEHAVYGWAYLDSRGDLHLAVTAS